MKEQLDLLEGLLKSDRVKGRQRIAKICVLSAYMKRRSNLCLLAESEKQTSTKELDQEKTVQNHQDPAERTIR